MGGLVKACYPSSSSELDNAWRKQQQLNSALRGWGEDLVSPSIHSLPRRKRELLRKPKVNLHLKTLAASHLELAGAMEDGSEDALKQENPGGRKFLKFPDSSQGLRWGCSSSAKGVGSGGSSQAGQRGLAGERRSSSTLEYVSNTPESCQGPQGGGSFGSL